MSFFSEAGGEVKNIPWWAWAGGAVALLFFGSHLLNKQNSAAATSADVASSGGSAGGIDSTGSVGDIGSPGPQLYDGTGLPPRSVNPGPQPLNGTGLPPRNVNGPTKSSGSPTAAQTYTVRSGDTLYTIASRYHVDESTLYSFNSGTIEAAAKGHGFASSDQGHWIFPGEILKIPA